METIKKNKYQIDKSSLDIMQKDFLSESCNKEETLKTIKTNYENNGIIIDPHTAIGVGAAKKLSIDNCIVLSTAHPCKFPDAIMKAINKHEKLPNELQYLLNKNENFVKLKNNTEIVKQFIKKMIL